MPSNNSDISPLIAIGPIQVLSTSISRRLLGIISVLIGYNLIDWAAHPQTVFVSAIIHAAIGGLILFNGLSLSGVRFR
ncbi:hypothetical protein [Halocatena marina]|uniref:hypothetical protein n=1 Tax=Halocatena marina TaxID=2934937 RepID=UPI00200DE4A1|nr:hypothetical protein [Halocatena marina]